MPFPKTSIVDRRSTIVHKGFTLIELLVVIAIISILASFAVASYSGAQAKGRDSKRKADLDAIKKALELAKADTLGGAFYPGCPSAPINCTLSNTADTTAPVLTGTYMSKIPQDPKNSGKYVYTYVPTPANCTGTTGAGKCTDHSLVTCLENANDPSKDASPNTTLCDSTTSGKSYTITNP